MRKKSEQFVLLYQENNSFIAGDIPHPIDKQVIYENIASRLGLPYPFPPSTRKTVFLGCLASIFVFGCGGPGLFTLYAILSNFVFEFGIIMGAIVATLMLLFALVIIYKYVKILKASPTLIKDTYQSMVEQHNIVYGTVDFYEHHKIYYLIDNTSKLHTYFTFRRGAGLSIGSRLKILYLNENIHIVL